MSPTKKAPTIQDVARHAHVSTATVSRALSSPDRVSDGMRDKVNAAVIATGYTLNQAARSLRMRTSKTILTAMPNISNPFFSPILDIIEKEAAARGYVVLVANSSADTINKNRLAEYFHSSRVDGLLLFDGSLSPSYLYELFPDRGFMPVVIACECIDIPELSTISNDNFAASQRATQHLLDLGHTRIGHASAPRSNVLATERESGFLETMKSAGVSVPDNYVYESNFSIQSGADAASELMGLPTPPTAVFCANDEVAIGFISQARNMGFNCPDDVSVVGFDGIEVAEHFIPPLTTVVQPTAELARIATEILLDMLENGGPWIEPQRIVLKSKLIIRQSTAAPKRT